MIFGSSPKAEKGLRLLDQLAEVCSETALMVASARNRELETQPSSCSQIWANETLNVAPRPGVLL
jgi:hypothetical protein